MFEHVVKTDIITKFQSLTELRLTLQSTNEAYLYLMVKKFHKIQKISPGAYIFQRPFLRGSFLEGFIYGGKFVFQNQSG